MIREKHCFISPLFPLIWLFLKTRPSGCTWGETDRSMEHVWDGVGGSQEVLGDYSGWDWVLLRISTVFFFSSVP